MLADASTVCIIGLANRSGSPAHAALQLTACFQADFPSPAYFCTGSRSLRFPPLQPGAKPSIPSSRFSLTTSPFIFLSFPRLPEVSGGSREVTASCRPGPAVCLSNEPGTRGGQLIMQMRKSTRPKGVEPP